MPRGYPVKGDVGQPLCQSPAGGVGLVAVAALNGNMGDRAVVPDV